MLLNNSERSLSLNKITEELDKLANLYNKTQDEKYKLAWYKLLRKLHETL
jgi:hypothetical protein